MQHTVAKNMISHVIEAMTEKNIENYNVVATENGDCVVTADISNREMKKIKRIAWGKKKSKEIGLPVLTREDIGNLRTGIIPKEEAFWFEKARL